MKKILLIICILLTGSFVFSQNTYGSADDEARIVLNTYVPDQIEGISSVARNALENKLSQIATQNGMGGASFNPRFIMTANIVASTKNITPTVPPMHAYNLEVNLYIGDGIDGILYASHSVSVRGVGNNETKAYLEAIKNIKTRDPQYQYFIENAKRKIIEYYNANCDLIISEAKALESMHEYNAALATLFRVPSVCKECYEKCMVLLGPIFDKKIDHDCQALLAQATNAWNSGQDFNAGQRAIRFLAGIDPQASCFPSAIALSERIAKRVKEVDQREWNFLLKVQQDNVDISKLRIRAMRDIGVAYGSNQPRVIYNIRGWW